jgi:hypothetical protein
MVTRETAQTQQLSQILNNTNTQVDRIEKAYSTNKKAAKGFGYIAISMNSINL